MQTPFLLYQTEDGQTKIQTRLEDETVWLSQAQICELFQKSKSTINEHISNIFNESELEEQVLVHNFRTSTKHGAIKELTQSRHHSPRSSNRSNGICTLWAECRRGGFGGEGSVKV